MDTKGERREKKRNSLKKKSSDNRKSINLIIDLIKKRSKALKKDKKQKFLRQLKWLNKVIWFGPTLNDISDEKYEWFQKWSKGWSGIRELNSSLDLGKVA